MSAFDIARIAVVVIGIILALIRKQEFYAFISASVVLILFSAQDVMESQYWLAAGTLLLSIVPIVIGVLRFRRGPEQK